MRQTGGFVLPDEKQTAIKQKNHQVVLCNRNRVSISGVLDVESFNEEIVIADTEMGVLIIRGKDLHISKLSLENSELLIEGIVYACEYDDSVAGKKGGGFFSKLFR
jgi:sporulation protein YabP